MKPWYINELAPNRRKAAQAVTECRTLTPLARRYILSVIEGEDHIWGGQRNPERPMHIMGHGVESGGVNFMERLSIYPETASC